MFKSEGLDEITWREIDYTMPLHSSDSGSIDRMYQIIEDWLQRLKNLKNSTNPSDKQKEAIVRFTKFLLDHQTTENPERMKVIGSWCLDANPRNMPSDARVDFVYMPTYIAVAWLVLLREKFPDIVESFESYDEKLKQGLDFAAGRNLHGHGYDGYQEMLTAIDYLSMGGVFRFINRNHKFSIRFFSAVMKARKDLKKKVESENEGWGRVDEDKAELALLKTRGMEAE